jgi:hypothetical protein
LIYISHRFNELGNTARVFSTVLCIQFRPAEAFPAEIKAMRAGKLGALLMRCGANDASIIRESR